MSAQPARARAQLPLGAVPLRSSAVWIVLACTFVVGFVVAPAVVAPDQVPVLLRQAAPLGMLALGQTVLILGRGFDLSVGGVVALVNVLAAGSFAQSSSALTVALLCLGVGAAVGAINGAGVAFAGVSPFVITLGMAFILTGAVFIYTGGAPSGQIPEAIRAVSSDRFLGISFSVYVWIGIGLLLAVLLRSTWLGRQVYARGLNPEAARLAGVRTTWLDFGSYVFCGVCAAIGGLLLAGFVGTGTLGAGQSLLLASIAAAVVGGTTFEGGRGGVIGSLGGAFLLTVVAALLTGAGIAKAGNLITQGAVLLLAAALFRTRRRA